MFRVRDSHGKYKYSGRSKAKVIDNRDPLQRGRIRVDHSILGETAWVDYLRDPGTFDVPMIGDVVYIECDSGVYEFPICWGIVTRGEDINPLLPATFKRDVPTNRGFFTPGGNKIEMDDGEVPGGTDPTYDKRTTASRGIRITTIRGHKIQIFDDPDNSQEKILISDKDGDSIMIDSTEKKITITSLQDMLVDVSHGEEKHVTQNYKVSATASIDMQGQTANFQGIGGTNLGDNSSDTEIRGNNIDVGSGSSNVQIAGGTLGVARFGDRAFGIGNLGAPVSSTIIQASSKVKSG